MKTKQGICENCEDEYDEPKTQTLYFYTNEWVCSSCANQYKADLEHGREMGDFDEFD